MIGIIGAMRIEVDSLKGKLSDIRITEISGISFYCGKLNGVEVVVAVSGVGKVFSAICAQTMILEFGVKKIINIGVAGAVDPRLKAGDLAISAAACQYDMDTTAVGDELGMISGIKVIQLPADQALIKAAQGVADELGVDYLCGVIATGDKFVAEDQEKIRINKKFNALVADMESGAIAQVCYVNKIPFIALRVVSDNAGKDAQKSYASFLNFAAGRSVEIAEKLVQAIDK